jgi:hypothetical protein
MMSLAAAIAGWMNRLWRLAEGVAMRALTRSPSVVQVRESAIGNRGSTLERALVFSMHFGSTCGSAELPDAGVWFAFWIPRPAQASRSD